MRGLSWGVQWTHVFNNYYNLNTCLIRVSIYEHIWMGHDCTKTVEAARHRLDFTTASGTKRNIVKNLWNKFWTDKTTVKMLYSDDIHVFFNCASCGFVCLTDLDLEQTQTYRFTEITLQISYYTHTARLLFFVSLFHPIISHVWWIMQIIVWSLNKFLGVILASLFLGQNALFSHLFSHTSHPILALPSGWQSTFHAHQTADKIQSLGTLIKIHFNIILTLIRFQSDPFLSNLQSEITMLPFSMAPMRLQLRKSFHTLSVPHTRSIYRRW